MRWRCRLKLTHGPQKHPPVRTASAISSVCSNVHDDGCIWRAQACRTTGLDRDLSSFHVRSLVEDYLPSFARVSPYRTSERKRRSLSVFRHPNHLVCDQTNRSTYLANSEVFNNSLDRRPL